jgi:hypothetical protein
VYFNLLQDIAENPTHCQLDTGVVIDPAYFSMLTKEASFGLDELEKMVQEVNVDPRSTLRSIPALLEQLVELTRRLLSNSKASRDEIFSLALDMRVATYRAIHRTCSSETERAEYLTLALADLDSLGQLEKSNSPSGKASTDHQISAGFLIADHVERIDPDESEETAKRKKKYLVSAEEYFRQALASNEEE